MVVRTFRIKNTSEKGFLTKVLQDYTRSIVFLRSTNNNITIKSIVILIYINILTSLHVIFLKNIYKYLLLVLSISLFCIINGLIYKLIVRSHQEDDSLNQSLARDTYSFIYINYLSLSNLPFIIILFCTNIIPKGIYFFIFILFYNFYLSTNLYLNQILRMILLINIVILFVSGNR